MRESKNFGERTRIHENREPHAKYFLVYEGEATEKIYFDKINECRNLLNINELIDLVPVEREYHERGTSNPQKLVQIFLNSLHVSNSDAIPCSTLLSWIMGELIEQCGFLNNEYVQRKVRFVLNEISQEIVGDDANKLLTKNELDGICDKILSSLIQRLDIQFSWPDIVQTIGSDIEANHKITYNPDLDKVCFIIDRDKRSFKDNQYDNTLKACRDHGYGFFISNPCFEFWLLLHFPDVHNLTEEEKDKLLANKKTSKRTYAEIKLKTLFPGYNKANYDAGKLISMVSNAMENEQLFCENEEDLKNELGSRVGVLLKELTAS